ncbi:MAG: zf-HC2 domain-containing protein [Pyrinomonadaceae bacterium]
MNCEQCHDLVSEFVDGSLGRQDYATLNTHLEECLECSDVRKDLNAIVGFCREQRGQYEAPPNEYSLWLRIRNVIESSGSSAGDTGSATKQRTGWLSRVGHRSWELTFPQLAASVAAIIVVVSLATGAGVHRFGGRVFGSGAASPSSTLALSGASSAPEDRIWQQQQAISYWNQRVELNKARWSPQMRETFDRNLKVIDQAVNDSLTELRRNPHDEVSEEMLNAALNDKMDLLREFADL